MKHADPDFVDHLAQRLGVERDTALERLGDWLHRYEPVRRRAILVLEVAPARVEGGTRHQAGSAGRDTTRRPELRLLETFEPSPELPQRRAI